MGGFGVSGLRVMSNLKGSRLLGVEGASMSSRNRASSGVPPSEDPSGEVGYRSLAPPCQSRAQAVVGAPWVGRQRFPIIGASYHVSHPALQSRGLGPVRLGRTVGAGGSANRTPLISPIFPLGLPSLDDSSVLAQETIRPPRPGLAPSAPLGPKINKHLKQGVT